MSTFLTPIRIIIPALMFAYFFEAHSFALAESTEYPNNKASEQRIEKQSRKEIRAEKTAYLDEARESAFDQSNTWQSRLGELDAQNRIIGIELVIAGPTGHRIESRFGHAMLRFVDDDHISKNDLALSFMADVDSVGGTQFKGLMGSFKVFPQVRLFGNEVRYYTFEDDRPLDRYIIPTTAEIRHQLVQNLFDANGKQGFGQYTFFKNNCAGALLQFLKNGGIDIPKKISVNRIIPTGIPKFLKNIGLIQGDFSRIEKKSKWIPVIAFKLGMSEQTLMKQDSLGAKLDVLNSNELAFLVDSMRDLPSIEREKLLNLLTERGEPEFETVHGVHEFSGDEYEGKPNENK